MAVLVIHAVWNEEPARKILLGENIWFITEVLPVDKDAMLLLPTFKFNYYRVLFFKRWHAWISSGFTSWSVRDNALQTLFSRTSSLIDAGIAFISSDSRWRCWALLTVFLSSWTILSVSKRLQFLLTVSSELRTSYHLRKSSKRLVRSDSLEGMPSTLINSSVNSSFERFSS